MTSSPTASDNFATRFLVNDACYFAQKTLVSAAVTEFEGQLATYKGHLPGLPCYRCLFPAPPPPDTVPILLRDRRAGRRRRA